jgi:hypothetical protein
MMKAANKKIQCTSRSAPPLIFGVLGRKHKMTFDDELRELHCDSLCDPQCWQEKADHLKQVSSLLRPKVQEYWSAPIDNRDDKEHFVSMHLMICAYAIENLLKGILIAENQEDAYSD